jgi:hypothetical protein
MATRNSPELKDFRTGRNDLHAATLNVIVDLAAAESISFHLCGVPMVRE